MTDQAQQVWTDTSILEFLQEHGTTLRLMGVQQIGLFGSYVRGEQHSGSDIDFLVVMRNDDFMAYARVWNYLEKIFGCKVDLVPEDELREELRSYVLSEVRYVEGL